MRRASVFFAGVVMAMTGLSTVRADVWYVPGWNRTAAPDDLAYPACTNMFGDARCAFKAWDGDGLWPTAVRNADAAAERFADEIAALDPDRRAGLTLVGHSLGGRIVTRVLARLARRGLKIRQGILLAPAIPMTDADVAAAGGGSAEPVLLIVNPRDTVLKYAYALGSGEEGPSLGADGAVHAIANLVEYAVPSRVTDETEIAAPWGRSETVKRLCNHLAPFYFAELRRILDGEPSPDAQVRVPQGNVNVEWQVLDRGLWWDVAETCRGWKLERNKVTLHCRILDPERRRVAWGSEADMRRSFLKVRAQLEEKTP